MDFFHFLINLINFPIYLTSKGDLPTTTLGVLGVFLALLRLLVDSSPIFWLILRAKLIGTSF